MASKAATRTRKVKSPEQQLIRLARRLLPEIQARRGDFTFHDVQNRTEDDQRHMIRSKDTRTLRRITRIEKLERSHVLTKDQAQACQWYANAYTLGYDTIGVVADYGRSGGGGSNVFCLLSKYRAQREARADYEFAKAGIVAWALPTFERVILEGQSLTQSLDRKAAPVLQLAAWQLHGRIAHLLSVQ